MEHHAMKHRIIHNSGGPCMLSCLLTIQDLASLQHDISARLDDDWNYC